MRCTLGLFFMLVVEAAPAAAQAVSPDSQIAQTMLTEIRALRLDLRNTAATVQRMQIVMHRIQAQAALLDKATQRRDQARFQCRQAQEQQKLVAAQIESVRRQNSSSGGDRRVAEQQLQETLEMWAAQAQECQVEQADAEREFRTEEVKMSELENQLDQLDQVLAGRSK